MKCLNCPLFPSWQIPIIPIIPISPMMTFRFLRGLLWAGLILLPAVAGAADLFKGGGGIPKPEEEPKLIAVLQSDAGLFEKARACQQLAIIGTKACVRALTPLLSDEKLSSYARDALERIPGPDADLALINALLTLKGKPLIGVVNSEGVRRDARALEGLVVLARNPVSGAAPEALLALGQIETPDALAVLRKILTAYPDELRPAAAEGCLLGAERQTAQGNLEAAIALYDAVRGADVPKPLRAAAALGAIRAKGPAAVPLVVSLLKSEDRELLYIGLLAAREVPGEEATCALFAELSGLAPERQALLITALADRHDKNVLPSVLEAFRVGPKAAQLAALRALERIGDASCLPVLLEAAFSDDAEIAQAAKAALAALPGQEVDAGLAAGLKKGTGKTRQLLLELTGRRRIESALPDLLPCAEDADAGIRAAAFAAIAVLGGEKEVAGLVKLLQKTTDPGDRAGILKALTAATARGGAACAAHLLPLARGEDSPLRVFAMQVLPCAGGPEALAAVTSALNDKDETVQDEAVRTLSTWPNKWPQDTGVAEPLLALAKSSPKAPHRILALRGYLQYLQGSKKVEIDERLAKVNDVLPLLTRPEEKRLAISVLSSIGRAGALKALVAFAAEPAIAGEACSGIVSLAENQDLKGVSKEERQQALQTAAEKAKSAAIRNKAQELLKASR